MKRIVVLLILCTALTAACTNTKWVRATVANQHEFNVALEQSEQKGVVVGKHYAHPYQINASDLAKLMKDLKYSKPGGLMSSETESPVFLEDEIDRLAPALAEALAKADAGQRIRFTSFNQQKMLLFSAPGKTEGVVFIEPAGQLNIVFNVINAKRQASETSAINPNFSKIDPLKIKSSDTALSVTGPYTELHKFDTGEPAPMWLVADLEKLQAAVSSSPLPTVKTGEGGAPAAAPKIGIKDSPVAKPAPDQAPDVALKEAIKIKLKYLKELLDEGLISEQDYTAKKKELLDNI